MEARNAIKFLGEHNLDFLGEHNLDQDEIIQALKQNPYFAFEVSVAIPMLAEAGILDQRNLKAITPPPDFEGSFYPIIIAHNLIILKKADISDEDIRQKALRLAPNNPFTSCLLKLKNTGIQLTKELTDLIYKYSINAESVADILILLNEAKAFHKGLKQLSTHEMFPEYILIQIKNDLESLKKHAILDKNNALTIVNYPYHSSAATTFGSFADLLIRLHKKHLLNEHNRTILSHLTYSNANEFCNAEISSQDIEVINIKFDKNEVAKKQVLAELPAEGAILTAYTSIFRLFDPGYKPKTTIEEVQPEFESPKKRH